MEPGGLRLTQVDDPYPDDSRVSHPDDTRMTYPDNSRMTYPDESRMSNPEDSRMTGILQDAAPSEANFDDGLNEEERAMSFFDEAGIDRKSPSG